MKSLKLAAASLLLAAVFCTSACVEVFAECDQKKNQGKKTMQTTTKSDIVDTAVANGNFNTLVAAVKQPG